MATSTRSLPVLFALSASLAQEVVEDVPRDTERARAWLDCSPKAQVRHLILRDTGLSRNMMVFDSNGNIVELFEMK